MTLLEIPFLVDTKIQMTSNHNHFAAEQSLLETDYVSPRTPACNVRGYL